MARLTIAVVVAAVTLCTFVAPGNDMETLHCVTAGCLILAFSFGPLLRGAQPRPRWVAQMASGLCLLPALLPWPSTLALGPFDTLDFLYFTSYALLFTWLVLLSRRLGSERGPYTALDALAATVGVALGVWTWALAPVANGALLPSGLVWAAYPVADVLVFVLCVHLGLRRGGFNPALNWLMAALTVQFFLDGYYAYTEVMLLRGRLPDAEAGYLVSYLCLALAATHPSVVQLGTYAGGPDKHRSGRGPALILFTISPVLLAAAVQVTGILDMVVRVTLITLQLALLFVRLSWTMAALTQAETQSHHRATHDPLTGLVNRASLMEEIDRRIKFAAESSHGSAAIYLDCDNFKYVNDTWGHGAGDVLLQDIASRVKARLGPDVVFARFGGDEFVILTPTDSAAEAMKLADRVLECFQEPLRIGPHSAHRLSPSIGVAVVAPEESVTGDELLGRADAAMYEAKQLGRGRCVLFGEELATRTRYTAAVGARLHEAISNKSFTLQLQPIMGGTNYTRLIGWESLARWRDPELGEVSPKVFIPLAEQHGLIGELGDFMLRQACLELARLRAAMPGHAPQVSVNISPAQLLQPDFVQTVREALSAAGLAGGALKLEITETLLIDRGAGVVEALEEVRRQGTGVCIDDFGSGYATLETLLRLPIDSVKLDKSLIDRLCIDDAAPRQIRAVIDLLASLGIHNVVAEGVETPQQSQLLQQLGCPMVQGWLYGRPMSPHDLLASAQLSAQGGDPVASPAPNAAADG
ncbi:putative bifunctional diguanylate cyclase/phosphodiesterase [Gephyromycinifex aptenodytis]|uniref:putative bifunctional diguanylate cyclase/phosphodiesterase n=1 Tax=Gephyromycinifex aptenodytis TaxID=2716227 RepID=UPI0014487552|nr:EAL domain-containing protein [Gephyromycinifex aptenodytis]